MKNRNRATDHWRPPWKSPNLRSPNTNPAIDPFIEVTQAAWDRLASDEDWPGAAAVGKFSAEKRPALSYGWENWAWSLHKQGESLQAYQLLAPLMKSLKLPGPPSGRAAWCLACFCAELKRTREAKRWLRMSAVLAQDKSTFEFHTQREPVLQAIWCQIAEVS